MAVLLVIHVIIATALIGAVLLQRSETDGFGLGSGSGMNLLTGRASASLMTRTTAILATLFILNSLALSIIAARTSKPSILETIKEEQAASPQVPLAIGKDEQSKATGVGINRDAAVDTNAVAKEATQEKAPEATTTTISSADKSAPTVPTAE